MEVRLDLHIHSAYSHDGRMSLEEIVSLAKAAGLQGCAVCDHDRVLTNPPEIPDFLLIPGVEVSTQFGHLLGLFVSRPIETRDFYEAVEAIHAQGGLAVLAHPFERRTSSEAIDPIAPLLDGVEIWNSRADRKNHRANEQAVEFAARHQLPYTAGSDAHVPQEVGCGSITLTLPELTLEAAKSALLRGEGHVSGKRGKSRWVAESQLTSRKKKGASWKSYCKWALFAVKCCAEDLIHKGD